MQQTTLLPALVDASSHRLTSRRRRVGEGGGPGGHKQVMWEHFKKHHYKSEGLNPVAECAVARWRGEPIGFIAVLPQPGGQFTWPTARGSRTVIEPVCYSTRTSIASTPTVTHQ